MLQLTSYAVCWTSGITVSFLVYISPLPTYARILKRRSSEGIFIESTYLAIFIIHAAPASKILAGKYLLTLNVGVFALVIVITSCAFKGESQVEAVGWAWVIFSVIVFAASFTTFHSVIRTKNVKYIPWSLSFTQAIAAVIWFFYGFVINDYFITFPNLLGYILSILKIALYQYCKNSSIQNAEQEHPNLILTVVNEKQLVVVESVNSTEGQITDEPGHNVMVETVDDGSEIKDIQVIIIQGVENEIVRAE